MNWFERITGFKEHEQGGYDGVRAQLSVVDGRLHSLKSKRSFGVGRLETPSLAELREQAAPLVSKRTPTQVSCVRGDAQLMHADPQTAGSLFQVASQFNLLEMISSTATPEQGVSDYEFDKTQGPACAIAAGAGTIYRNYFAPVNVDQTTRTTQGMQSGQPGQREDRQIDCLAGIGSVLGNENGHFWHMRNGYCMVTDESLTRIDDILSSMSPDQVDGLRRNIRIGAHWDVEVTQKALGEGDSRSGGGRHQLSQAFCSALPVSYNRIAQPAHWILFAKLVLDATYEATLLLAMLNKQRLGNPCVYLTRVGGGAFGNDPQWIDSAMHRALFLAKNAGLDVRIVSQAEPAPSMLKLARQFTAVRD